MKKSGSYSPVGVHEVKMSSSKQQAAVLTKIIAGSLQLAILILLVFDGIEVREISRNKFYLDGDPNDPYGRSYAAASKDSSAQRKVKEINIRLGLLITLMVLSSLKQPLFWTGTWMNQIHILGLSTVIDIICFVLYLIHLVAFSDNLKEVCSAGLAVSFLSCIVTGAMVAVLQYFHNY
jgi:hypothetical protein